MKTLILLIISISTFFSVRAQNSYPAQNIELIGRWASGSAKAVFNMPGYVYLGNGGIFEIYSTADVSNPAKIGSVTLHGTINDIYVLGNYAYVASGNFGLEIVNISSPSQPFIENYIVFDDEVTAIDVSDAYVNQPIVFVLTDKCGLYAYDLSDMTNPKQLSHLETYGYGKDLFGDKHNLRLYCAEYDQGFEIIDVSNPQNLTSLGKYNTSGSAYGIAVQDNKAYVADYHKGLVVVDVANAAAPQKITTFSTHDLAYDVVVFDTLACVAIGGTGLEIIDLTEKAYPEVVPFDDNGTAEAISRCNTNIFVADGSGGVKIVSVDVGQSTIQSQIPTAGNARGIAVNDPFIYVADGFNGLKILDASDYQNPVLAGEYLFEDGYAKNVFVMDTLAFVAAGNAGLLIFNVSNPSTPQLISSVEFESGDASGVYVKNDTVFIANGENGIQIYSIADLTNPQYLSHFNTGYRATNIVVRGTYAYVSDYLNGFEVYDISDLSSVSRVGASNVPVNGMDLFVTPPYAFVAGKQSGVRILDITNLSAVTEMSYFRPSDYSFTYGVFAQDTLLYLADGSEGLHVVHISDPTQPALAGYFQTGGYARDVFVRDSIIFVADENDGVYILKYAPMAVTIEEQINNIPENFQLYQNFPNPFNPATVIRYRLSTPAHVRLVVYDVVGKVVKELINRQQGVGQYQITFNAKGLSSGVYLYRLETSHGFSQVRKMILLR
jgi:hypothetical protein